MMNKTIGLMTLGLFSGVLGASLGIGAGTIIVPCLMFFFGTEIKAAISTSLVVMLAGSASGTAVYFLLSGNSIDVAAVIFLAAGSVFGAWAGSYLSQKIHSKAVKILFAILLIAVSFKLIGVELGEARFLSPAPAYPLLLAIGLAAGLLSAFFGIGGGIVVVPALTLIWNFDIHTAIPTSLAVIPFTCLFGVIFHFAYGNLDKKIAKAMAPYALLGGVVGAAAAGFLPDKALHILFGALLVIAAGRMLYLGVRKEKG